MDPDASQGRSRSRQPCCRSIVALGGMRDPPTPLPSAGSEVGDIPQEALAAYRYAAADWEIDWAILAGRTFGAFIVPPPPGLTRG